MTALPLFWNEAGPALALEDDDQRAPVMRLLMEAHDVRPLDVLSRETLANTRILMLAQPRLLAPQELVALDQWVREGGRLLLFADPELRWPSALVPGDPRRPPPVTLLDPLFNHWRVELGPPGDADQAELADRAVPVSRAGQWTSRSTDCKVETGRLLVGCTLGKGRALLVADADLLDIPDGADRTDPAFSALLALIDTLSR